MEGEHWVAAPVGASRLLKILTTAILRNKDADAQRERQCNQRQQLLMPYTQVVSLLHTRKSLREATKKQK